MKTRFYAISVILLLVIFSNGTLARAKTGEQVILVTTAADSGQGSLRSALQKARPGDHIRFDPEVFPMDDPTRIFLDSQLPSLNTGGVTIDGTGAGVILDGSLLGTPTQSGFLDDIQLLTETGENLLVNGDFQVDLKHWMLWQSGEDNAYLGIARWTDAEGVENPGAVELAPHARGGEITLAYHNRNQALDLFGAGNEPSGRVTALPLGNTKHLTLLFQHKLVNLGIRIEVNNEDSSGSYDVYGQSFDYSGEWTQGVYEMDVPDGATELFLNFNIFSSEYLSGLVIESSDNVIQGLQIENFPGDAILLMGASRNQIGGARAGMQSACLSPCNLLSGNLGSGVSIDGGSKNNIQGNFMGVDISGKQAQSNGFNGIRLFHTTHNLIGGEAGEGNLIGADSIEANEGTAYNEIRGNYIGVDISGEKKLGNPHQALSFAFSSHDNIVEHNIISASEVGIQIDHESYNNEIRNNAIGTDLSHTLDLGNQTGVYISNDSYNNQIGPGNYILFNRERGVYITGSQTLGNRITQNVIEHNPGGQIVVNALGGWLSPPTITRATTREVSGVAQPNSMVEIYTSDDGHGGKYVKTVETSASGAFHTTFAQDKLTGQYVALLTFDNNGTTSEFSVSIAPEEVFLREIPGLISREDVSTDIRVIGVNALLAIFILVYVGIGSTYFNEALENYPDEVQDLFVEPVKKFLARIFPKINKTRKYNLWRIVLTWLLILLIISVVQSFLDVESIFTKKQVNVIATLFLGGFIVSSLQTLGEFVMRKSFKKAVKPTQAKVGWPGAVLAGISTTISIVLNLVPGLVLGAVDTFFLEPSLAEEGRDEDTLNAWRTLIVKSTVLIITFLGWWYSDKTGNLMPLMELAFAVGLQYVFFELIPLDVLDGAVLLKTKKWYWYLAWGVLIGLASFGLFHLALNPDSSDVRDIMTGSVKSLALVFAILGILVIAMRWLIAHHRREKFEMTIPAWGTVLFIAVFLVASLLVQYRVIDKIGAFDMQAYFFAEPTPTPMPTIEAESDAIVERAPYTILTEANFDTSADLESIDLFNETDIPSQSPNEDFIYEGALRIGGGHPLGGGNLRSSFSAGSFAHLRTRLSPDSCHHIDLGFNNDREEAYWKGLRIDGCANNSYGIYALQENNSEHMEDRLSFAGPALIVPNEWTDIVFWLTPEGDKVYVLIAVNGNVSYSGVQLQDDWQYGKAFLGFGGWLDLENQFMGVDFIRVGEGSLEEYLADNVPAFTNKQATVDAFIESQPQSFPELVSPEGQGSVDGEPDSVVAEWLYEADIVFAEDTNSMAENEGG